MSELVANCPRCRSSKITFDLMAANFLSQRYNWQRWYEAFCICRHCQGATIFVLSQKDIAAEIVIANGLSNLPAAANYYVNIEGIVTAKDFSGVPPPEHLPPDLNAAFNEGAMCLAISCYNAAGTMFRLCVDLATRSKLPPEANDEPVNGLTKAVRRSLGLRLGWLFDKGVLPENLRDLSACIKDDGNDGAHLGNLGKNEAEDLLDFTVTLLERIFTEPERLRLAKERREKRKAG